MIDKYLNLLEEFISIESISTDKEKKQQCVDAANWLKNLFTKYGFESSIEHFNHINPIVFASYVTSPEYKTILIYGHYDVQPAQIDGWKSDPFRLNKTADKIYGRGVVDNKGQILLHITSIISLIEEKALKYNIKFLIEGNEETGNDKIAEYIKNNLNSLKCDYLLISDGEILGDNPIIEASLRGGFNVKVTIQTANIPVHSGIYGGAVPNAAHEAAMIINKIYDDETNLVKIDGFFDDVDVIDESDLQNIEKLANHEEHIYDNLGINSDEINKTKSLFELTGLLPTIQVTGFQSGYTDDGFANIVPNKAEFKLNFRIVSNQNSDHVFKKFQSWLQRNMPKYVKYELEIVGKHEPIKLRTDSEFHNGIKTMLERVYGQEVLFKNVGGALPIVKEFIDILKVEPILIPLGNDDCAMHGPNENFDISLIKKGLNFSKSLFSN